MDASIFGQTLGAAASTLFGGALGGLFRLAPEMLKWLDRKSERAHELAMQDKALDFEKARAQAQGAALAAQADAAWDAGAVQALSDALRAQGAGTGAAWADALSSSVRPVVTYWFMGLYCAAKTAGFFLALKGNPGDWAAALQAAWTGADQAMWAGVLNFWFLGRVFDKARR